MFGTKSAESWPLVWLLQLPSEVSCVVVPAGRLDLSTVARRQPTRRSGLGMAHEFQIARPVLERLAPPGASLSAICSSLCTTELVGTAHGVWIRAIGLTSTFDGLKAVPWTALDALGMELMPSSLQTRLGR